MLPTTSFLFLSTLPVLCCAARFNSIVAPKVKSLRSLAEERVGFFSNIYLAHARHLPLGSPYTKAIVLSELLPRLLGIKSVAVKKLGISLPLFSFDQQRMVGLESLGEEWQGLTVSNYFNEVGREFIQWVVANRFFLSIQSTKRVIEETFDDAELMAKYSETLADTRSKSMGETMLACSWFNRTLSTAIKNIFPRDNMDSLKFSYLTPVLYLIRTPALENPVSSWNAVSISQVSNAAALSLFQNDAGIFQKYIRDSLESFVLKGTKSRTATAANILDLLMVISLSQNDYITEKLLSRIDLALITDPMKLWIKQHIGAHRSDYLLQKMAQAGIDLPENVDLLPIRELTHFNHHNHFRPFFSGQHISTPAKGHVDLYTIDPTRTYYSEMQLLMDAKLQVERIKVFVNPQDPRTMLSMAFPQGTVVTPLMVELLTKWAMNLAMTAEEDKLARMIILVDQVTIIRTN